MPIRQRHGAGDEDGRNLHHGVPDRQVLAKRASIDDAWRDETLRPHRRRATAEVTSTAVIPAM